jgi:WD40 repeat protein
MKTRQPKQLTVAICVVLLLFLAQGIPGKGLAALAQKITAAQSAPPDYLIATKDPVSGLTLTRITKPGKLGQGIECGKAYCGHRYSSAQAWNADQSLLLIASGCGGLCFLDGQTYQPLFFRSRKGNCEWHPLKPELMVCVDDREIRFWNPRTDEDTLLFSTAVYTNLEFGPGKGNVSHDGNRIAVRALTNTHKMVVFVYDLRTRIKYRDIDLSQLPGENGYCTITPLGQKLACFQTLPDQTQQTFILNTEGGLLQSWLENHRPGHGDMTVTADGAEIMVGISKSVPDKYNVIMRRLDDGAVTRLLPYGEATHVSLRSTISKGWAFVSYEGDPEEIARHPKWAPYGREIIALALDGSARVRRIAQTNNIKVNYNSETHASPSPDGTQIIWSSNWGNPGGPVYEFVTRLPSLSE